jgi:hypothetical protein
MPIEPDAVESDFRRSPIRRKTIEDHVERDRLIDEQNESSRCWGLVRFIRRCCPAIIEIFWGFSKSGAEDELRKGSTKSGVGGCERVGAVSAFAARSDVA